MKYAVKWLVLAGLVIGLLFLVRCLCAPFSSQIRRQMSRHRALHLIWAGFGLFTAFGLLDLVHSMAWPYTWLERRAQRERVAERVQSAGGWDSLLRDNYPFGLFATPMSNVVRLHASSGTTGASTVVGYTKRDIETWVVLMGRCFVAAGLTKNDIIHNAYGYGLFTGGLALRSRCRKNRSQCDTDVRC